MHPNLLSPRELAEVMGVSESSVKRWADEGSLRARRTAGGHRRIAVPDAVRFIRETGAAVVRPHVLGLPGVAAAGERTGVEGHDDEEALFTWLRQGEAADVRGLLESRYLEGAGIAELMDGPVRGALERLGELWLDGEEGIFEEHRATDLLLDALHRLAALVPEPAGDAPVAVGGGPEDDPHLLPSLGVSMVLADAGFRAVNLGPDAPAASLVAAVAELAPRLVWVSVTSHLLGGLEGFWRELVEGVPATALIVAGGRCLGDAHRAHGRRVVALATMGELEAFLRGLDAGPDRRQAPP